MAKTTLPDIGDELNAAANRQARPVDLRKLPSRGLAQDDVETSANASKLGAAYGASTSMPALAAPVVALRMDVPDYVDEQLRSKAFAEKVTKAYLILRALAANGFEVREADLVGDRRRNKPGREKAR